MTTAASENATSGILAFLREIDLPVTEVDVSDRTFLPGIDIVNGGLVVDRSKLKYPGDLLHEAAHLAIAPASRRPFLNGEVEIPGTEPPVLELAAMLWSFAACVHLRLDPRVVFHEHGYHGQAGALLKTFELGVFPGVSFLVEAGMTSSQDDAERAGTNPFPVMKAWLRS